MIYYRKQTNVEKNDEANRVAFEAHLEKQIRHGSGSPISAENNME